MLSSISYYIKSICKNQKKYIREILFSLCFLTAVTLPGCKASTGVGENERFEAYTKDLFCKEVSANTVSLHYTLKDPEEYGIKSSPVTFGTFDMNGEMVKASAENMRQALLNFEYNELDTENKLTYDILNYQLRMMKESADYILYEEPLGLVSGVQTQLPVVLSEYQFYDRQDVEAYLELLETTGEYFESLVEFEREKSAAGLFMADYAADTVISQCQAFLDMDEGNYLYSTFADRISKVDDLTEKEKNDYIQDNALTVNDYIFPPYEKLISAIVELKGSGKNEKGLAYLPEGKDYYELEVRDSTGSERSVEEM